MRAPSKGAPQKIIKETKAKVKPKLQRQRLRAGSPNEGREKTHVTNELPSHWRSVHKPRDDEPTNGAGRRSTRASASKHLADGTRVHSRKSVVCRAWIFISRVVCGVSEFVCVSWSPYNLTNDKFQTRQLFRFVRNRPVAIPHTYIPMKRINLTSIHTSIIGTNARAYKPGIHFTALF